MKKTLMTVLAAIAMLSAASQEPTKEKEKVKTNASINTANVYAARPGFLIGSGPAVQPSMNANYKGMTAFVWGTHDMTDKETKEIDIGLKYGRELIDGKLNADIGYQHWFFPAGDASSHVIEAGVHYRGVVDIDATLSQLIEEGKDKN